MSGIFLNAKGWRCIKIKITLYSFTTSIVLQVGFHIFDIHSIKHNIYNQPLTKD